MTLRYNNPYHAGMAREFASGWIGGALGIFVTHPIDTVRVRLQHAATNGKTGVTYSSASPGIVTLTRNVYSPMLGGFHLKRTCSFVRRSRNGIVT